MMMMAIKSSFIEAHLAPDTLPSPCRISDLILVTLIVRREKQRLRER